MLALANVTSEFAYKQSFYGKNRKFYDANIYGKRLYGSHSRVLKQEQKKNLI